MSPDYKSLTTIKIQFLKSAQKYIFKHTGNEKMKILILEQK